VTGARWEGAHVAALPRNSAGATPLTLRALENDAQEPGGGYSTSLSQEGPGVSQGAAGGGGGGQAVDSKQFFRTARSVLSYEGFNEFLANIKRLNNQQQSREETLEQARRIFGPEHRHLHQEFEQLLSRHAM